MSPARSFLASMTAVVIAVAVAGCGRGQAAAPPAGQASPYIAVARGSIGVEGGLLPLSAAVAGMVDTVNVHAGDHVRKGQVLATFQATDAQAAVTIAQGRLDQARARARLTALQLKAARKRAHTLAEAAAAGADAGQHATQAAERADELAASAAADKAAVAVARGQLEQARHALDLHTLRAPLAARVSEVQVQPGESISPQSGPLFTLLPDAARIVTAEINSDFVGKLHKGMRAEVVLDNDSEQRIGMAHVKVVGQVFGPSTLEQDPSVRANTRTVKCQLRFDRPHDLRIGQRVLVRFLPDASATR